MNNMEIYKKVFMDTFNVGEEDLNENLTNVNVDRWDSITQMNLVAGLEEAFDILMDTDDIFELDSFVNGMNVLKKYGVEL